MKVEPTMLLKTRGRFGQKVADPTISMKTKANVCFPTILLKINEIYELPSLAMDSVLTELPVLLLNHRKIRS
jgi:hypothetical protein